MPPKNWAGLSTGPSGRNLEIPSPSGREDKVKHCHRFGLDGLDINDYFLWIDESCVARLTSSRMGDIYVVKATFKGGAIQAK